MIHGEIRNFSSFIKGESEDDLNPITRRLNEK